MRSTEIYKTVVTGNYFYSINSTTEVYNKSINKKHLQCTYVPPTTDTMLSILPNLPNRSSEWMKRKGRALCPQGL